MTKTNWQDPKTSEITSPQISGLQEAVGKIEESIGMESIAETDIPLSEVFISNDDRCRIFQAPEGKRNWLLSPSPIIKKNGDVITDDFEIDYGGGAVVFTTPILETDVLTADATYTINQSAFNENIEVTKSPIGFPNRIHSIFSFDKSTRVFTIEPMGESYEVFFKGKRFIKDNPETVVIPNTTGLYYIYFNQDGILSASTNFPGLQSMIYISYVYWNENQDDYNLQFGPGDERHGTVMDKATHERLHAIDWTQWVRGLQLYDYKMNDPSSNDAPKVSITDGVVADEDLFHNISHSPTPSNFFEQILQDFALLPVMYREGTNGEWRQDEATEYPFKNTDLGRVNFNEFDVEWKQSQVPNNGFVACYIVFSADIEQPIKVVQGQRTDNTLADAQANNDDRDISWGNVPFQEFKVLYRLILQTSDSFTNDRKAMLVDVLDLRTARRSPGGGGIIPSAHSNLTGLDYASSGHTGFASQQALDSHEAEKASQLELGHVKVDGATITVDEEGIISAEVPDINISSKLDKSGGILEGYSEKLVLMAGSNNHIDLNSASIFFKMATSNITLTISSPLPYDLAISFTLHLSTTSSVGTVTFPSSIRWQNGEIPDLTTVNKTYILTFITVDGGTTWLGMFGGEF